MNTTNYIKVLARASLSAKLVEVGIVFFDDSNYIECHKALEIALSLRVGFGPKLTLFRRPPNVEHRGIDRLPVIGEMHGGLRRFAAEAR